MHAHQLRALLFSDSVGFSRQMAVDEGDAIAQIRIFLEDGFAPS